MPSYDNNVIPALLLATVLHWSGTNPAMGDTGTYAHSMPCPLATDSLIRHTQTIPLHPCKFQWRTSARACMKGQPFTAYGTYEDTCYVIVIVYYSRITAAGEFTGRQRSILGVAK